MSMSTEVQAAIYGRPEDLPKLGISPVQVSKHGDLYEFKFGKFHIYHHELDVGYCARKLLDNGWGPQGLETHDRQKRGASSTRCRNRPPVDDRSRPWAGWCAAVPPVLAALVAHLRRLAVRDEYRRRRDVPQ